MIRWIEIEHYKDHLHVLDPGRVNLIGGKNDAGKTAFLEACILGEPYYFLRSRLQRGVDPGHPG